MPGSDAYKQVTGFARDLLIAVEKTGGQDVLRRRLAEAAIDLVERVIHEVAAPGSEPSLRIDVQSLRVLMVLARDVNLLDEESFRPLATQLQAVASAL